MTQSKPGECFLNSCAEMANHEVYWPTWRSHKNGYRHEATGGWVPYCLIHAKEKSVGWGGSVVSPIRSLPSDSESEIWDV